MAFLDALMSTNSSGMIIGKLNTAIKELLFDAFDAIALVKVSAEDKPIEPKNRTNKYIILS